MKKKFLLFMVSAAVGFTVASAQADSINKVAQRANELATEKMRDAEKYRDSIKNSNLATAQEKEVLNKDYNTAERQIEFNKQQAIKQLNSNNELDSAEALRLYNHNRRELNKDSSALHRQHRELDKALEDGLTDKERAAIHEKYMQDKKHYIEDKKKLNHQKDVITDSTHKKPN